MDSSIDPKKKHPSDEFSFAEPIAKIPNLTVVHLNENFMTILPFWNRLLGKRYTPVILFRIVLSWYNPLLFFPASYNQFYVDESYKMCQWLISDSQRRKTVLNCEYCCLIGSQRTTISLSFGLRIFIPIARKRATSFLPPRYFDGFQIMSPGGATEFAQFWKPAWGLFSMRISSHADRGKVFVYTCLITCNSWASRVRHARIEFMINRI